MTLYIQGMQYVFVYNRIQHNFINEEKRMCNLYALTHPPTNTYIHMGVHVYPRMLQ